MQGRVTIAFVRLLHEFLEQRGFNAESVLAQPKPDEDAVGDGYIATREWGTLLERAERAVDVPAFGLVLGASISAAHLGVLGYVLRHCSTLWQALNRLHHYERLLSDTNPCQVRMELRGIALEWGTELGRAGQTSDECSFAMLLTYVREQAGLPDLAPTELRFVNPEPPSLQPYLDFFKCPVLFNAPKTVVRFSYPTLARRIPHHEPTLLALLEQQAREKLNRLPPVNALQSSLHNIIATLLPEGKATLAACASKLHCSTRTLQRRLLVQQINFQTLLDEVRFRLAESYMADPRIKLAEVALMLGFADQAAFTHAFTRWTGLPPARWRARLHETQESRPVEL